MEDQNTQQNPDPSSSDNQQEQVGADGGLIVVMTDSYGTTDDSDETPGAQEDAAV